MSQLHPLTEEILNSPASEAFLQKTDGTVDGPTVARLVAELHEGAVVPERLVATCQRFRPGIIDVCGTGGSKGHRLNTSTLTALLAPSLGIGVVKHGGRSASGKLGSLDLLERLGLDLTVLFHNAAESLRTDGLAYLGARFTYECFGKFAPIRKAYGRPTLFNLLGPLLNPVRPASRILGTYSESVAELMATAVSELGEAAFVVVSNTEGALLDEASPFGETLLLDVSARGIRRHILPAVESVVPPLQSLFDDAASVALSMLNGAEDEASMAARKLVAYNLALASLLFTNLPEGRFQSELSGVYRSILATFSDRCDRAGERLARLRHLTPEHPATPVAQPSSLVAELNSAPAPTLFPHAATTSFAPLVTRSGTSPGWLFAEVKLRTPLREFPNFPLEDRLAAYRAADAVSVVTHPSFGGSLALLRKVRQLTDKPILAKDFIRTEAEVEALAAGGANGILLLEDMVEPSELATLVAACGRFGVTPFIESSWHLPKAPDASIPAVPVLNSRNLFTLAEGRSFRDAVAFAHAGGTVLFASGASSPTEVALFRRAGRGIIVGTALMQLTAQSDIENYIARCNGRRLLLKVCGAATTRDVELALEVGASLVGINLIPTSRRFVSLNALREMRSTLARVADSVVLLTSSATPAEHLHEVSPLNVIEQPYSVPLLTGRRGVLATEQGQGWHGTRMLVLDGNTPGSGRSDEYPSCNGKNPGQPTLVAGGVRPENIMQRIAEARQKGFLVAGVDAASSVEETTHTTPFSTNGRFSRERIIALRNALDNQPQQEPV
jgi:anthranilate phosphoribosyltransferase